MFHWRVNLTAFCIILLVVIATAACNAAPTAAAGRASLSVPSPTSALPHKTAASLGLTPEPKIRTATAAAKKATATPMHTLSINIEKLDGLKIRFWYVGRPDDRIASLAAEFNRSQAQGVAVQAQSFWGYGELSEAFESAINTGNPPDVLAVYNYQAASWARGDLLVDLSPYQSDAKWGLSASEQEDFYPVFWTQDLLLAEGTRYGLPFRRSAWLMFYNQTWARELGFKTPPVSPQEFERQVCAAAKANRSDADAANDGTGGWAISTEPQTFTAWLYAFDGVMLNAQGRYAFQTSQAAAALTFLRKLADNGCAWASQYPHPNASFANRRALAISASTGAIADQAALMGTDEWLVLPFPSVGEQPSLVTYGPSLAVVHTSPERQLAAWIFAKWLVSPENQAEWLRFDEGLPTRKSALPLLSERARQSAQTSAALALLPYARTEPPLASWSLARWATSDALTQLFTASFSADQIPALLKTLDQMAIESSVANP